MNKHFKKTIKRKKYDCFKCKKSSIGECYTYETLSYVTGNNSLKFCKKCYTENIEKDLIEFIFDNE